MSTEIFTKLAAPFDPNRISWRVGSTNKDKTKGMALAYIDARDVYERLDSVLGADKWQCRYSHADKKTVCDLGIKIGDEWIWKANGAGDSDIEAEKGALSDALKRAAVVWGIGRYLYDLDSPWVAIEGFGKSYRIRESEYARLAKLIGGSSKDEPTLAQKTAAAVKRAQSLAQLYGMFQGTHADFVRENADLIEKCSKYPEAEAILQSAELI